MNLWSIPRLPWFSYNYVTIDITQKLLKKCGVDHFSTKFSQILWKEWSNQPIFSFSSKLVAKHKLLLPNLQDCGTHLLLECLVVSWVFWDIVIRVVQFFDLVDNLWFQVFKILEIKKTTGSGFLEIFKELIVLMKELAKNQQFRVTWISYLKVLEVFFSKKCWILKRNGRLCFIGI